MKINNNISALLATGNLHRTEDRLTTSLTRLSSGYRINKAADDAAGMAISQKMHAQIRGLERASRNGSDGISFIQTAEGALAEVESMLQRCRELSVQASNDVTTLDDKEAIQQEIEALMSEIDRLATDTEFNTKSILDGTCCRQTSSSNTGVSLISMTDDVALTTYSLTVTQASTKTNVTTGSLGMGEKDKFTKDGKVQINGQTIEIEQGETLEEAYAKIRDCCESMNIDVLPVNGKDANGNPKEVALSGATSLYFESKIYGASRNIKITTDDPELATKLGINGAVITQGKDAIVSLDTDSGFTKTATTFIDGNRVTVSDRGGFEMIFNVAGAEAGMDADVTVLDAGFVAIQIGSNEGQSIDISIPAVTCESLNINYCNVCTFDGAQESITLFDEAISQVSAVRAKLGAYENRLDSATTSLDTTSQNLTEACSRIEDVDMAAEMTEYTQLTVLSQAGTSMLAQANNRPQTILQLLQG